MGPISNSGTEVHSNATGPPIRLCRCSFWQVVTRQNLPFSLWQLQKAAYILRKKTHSRRKAEKELRLLWSSFSNQFITVRVEHKVLYSTLQF